MPMRSHAFANTYGHVPRSFRSDNPDILAKGFLGKSLLISKPSCRARSKGSRSSLTLAKMMYPLAVTFFLVSGCRALVSTREPVAAPAPHTIQLQSRVAPKEAILRRRALNPTTVPLADFFLGTDLQCDSSFSFGNHVEIQLPL